MDTVTQFILGSVCAEISVARTPEKRGRVPLWILGGVAGTLPDLDVLIRSAHDPLLAIEYHRHFTHSIAFIPIGVLITLLFFWPWIRKEKAKYKFYAWAAIWAYGTHFALDTLTSYGTQIFRPFSDYRASLDWLSIVDPMVTLPWFLGLTLSVFLKTRVWAFLSMFWFFTYLAICANNHNQVILAQQQLAESRGHRIERSRALPTLGNSVLFRSIYEYDGQIYADSILALPWREGFFLKEGSSVKKYFLGKALPMRASQDLKRWLWFLDDYGFVSAEEPLQISDGRYTVSPEGWDSLWFLTVQSLDPYKIKRENRALERQSAGVRFGEIWTRVLNPEMSMRHCQYKNALTCNVIALR